MCQYADDTICFLKDVKSAKPLIDKLELFSRCSLLEINKSKTEALWLGSMKECKQKPFGFKWPDKLVLALGVYFSYNQVECNKLNFEEKLIKTGENAKYVESKRLNTHRQNHNNKMFCS